MAQRLLTGFNRIETEYDFEVGDLLEIKRGLYSHWVVYCGNQEVIHMTGDGYQGSSLASNSAFTISGVTYEKAIIRKQDLRDVVGDATVIKNNKLDSSHRAFSPAEILRRAKSKIGPVVYDVIWNNCEHFVNWCRYGKNVSEQADKVLTGVVLVGTAAVVGGLLSGISSGTKSHTN